MNLFYFLNTKYISKSKWVILLLALNFSLHAQVSQKSNLNKQRIDSILASLTEKDYRGKKESYTEINKLIRRAGHKNSESLFNYALSKDSSDIAKMIFYDQFSKSLSNIDLVEKALQLRFKGLEIAERLKEEKSQILFHVLIASSYIVKNKLDKSIYHLNLAEPLAEKKENTDLLWTVYYKRAEVEIILKNIDKAKKYYLKIWEIIKDVPNNSRKRFMLYVLVDFFTSYDYPYEQSKFTEILTQHYEDAYPDMPLGHLPINSIFKKRSDPKHIPQYEKVIRISDSLNNINSFIQTSYILSDIYSKSGKYNKALKYLTDVVKRIDTSKNSPKLRNIYAKLADISAQSKNYKNAYYYKNLESILQDSITLDKMQKNISELEVKFDTEKKERQILEQKTIINKKDNERNIMIYGLIASGIFALLIVLFYKNRLKYQKTIAQQNSAIQQQKIIELQQKNKLLALQSMIEGQEAERLRIAKDLHDSLGGLLSTVKAHFTTIQKEVKQLEKLDLAHKTNQLIDEACSEVRRTSHNMMPHALSISGLKGAIEDLASQLNEQGYKTILEIKELPENMEKTKKVMIYRLIQELISNITKHANAKSILIQLLGHKNQLHLLIEDDGKGFNYDKSIEKDGLGLKNINSRVEYLDGTIDWATQTNKGTSVSIKIPVK